MPAAPQLSSCSNSGTLCAGTGRLISTISAGAARALAIALATFTSGASGSARASAAS